MDDKRVSESLVSDHGNPRVLSGEQINRAIELIEDRHKLRSAPLRKVWPFLDYICCCILPKRKKRFDLALKKSLRRQLGLPVLKNDAKLEADPFLILGYGMNAYLDIMVMLMKMMGFISLVVLPIIFKQSSFGALS